MPHSMLFGLPRARVLDTAAAVRRTAEGLPIRSERKSATAGGHTRDAETEYIETFARAAWSAIVEPGDSAAHELITLLGAPAALTALVRDEPVAYWSAVLLNHHEEDRDPTATRDHVERALGRWRPRIAADRVLDILDRADRTDTVIIGPSDPQWPLALNDLGAHAPLCLWVRGNLDTLGASANSVSLVGARASSRYGENVTLEIASGLVDRGYAIVSGAAYGIDAVAHRATLASHGQTVAVLAGGADRPYPAGHTALLSRIFRDGVVISEVPNGTSPTRWRFLQRNRLIAALSRGTVVMEAGWRSGSLNTAGHAATLGRPLGAVPGPVTNASSAGCHRLVREYGAQLITDVDTVVELIEPLTASPPVGPDPGAPDPLDVSSPARYPAHGATPAKTRTLAAPAHDLRDETGTADHPGSVAAAEPVIAEPVIAESAIAEPVIVEAVDPSVGGGLSGGLGSGFDVRSHRDIDPSSGADSNSDIDPSSDADSNSDIDPSRGADSNSGAGPTIDAGPNSGAGLNNGAGLNSAVDPNSGISPDRSRAQARLAVEASKFYADDDGYLEPDPGEEPTSATKESPRGDPPDGDGESSLPSESPIFLDTSMSHPSTYSVPAPFTAAPDPGMVRPAQKISHPSLPVAGELGGSSRVGYPRIVGAGERWLSPGAESSEIARVRDCLSHRRPRQTRDIAIEAGLSLATVRAALGVLALHEEVFDNGDGWLLKVQPR